MAYYEGNKRIENVAGFSPKNLPEACYPKNKDDYVYVESREIHGSVAAASPGTSSGTVIVAKWMHIVDKNYLEKEVYSNGSIITRYLDDTGTLIKEEYDYDKRPMVSASDIAAWHVSDKSVPDLASIDFSVLGADRPNRNGVLFSKEAVENAISSLNEFDKQMGRSEPSSRYLKPNVTVEFKDASSIVQSPADPITTLGSSRVYQHSNTEISMQMYSAAIEEANLLREKKDEFLDIIIKQADALKEKDAELKAKDDEINRLLIELNKTVLKEM